MKKTRSANLVSLIVARKLVRKCAQVRERPLKVFRIGAPAASDHRNITWRT